MIKNKTLKVKSLMPNFRNPQELLKFLQQPTVVLAEFLTGVLSSDLTDYKLSTGRLIQAAVKGKILTQLGEELKQYRDEGKIKKDYFATSKSQATLLELLQFIDSDIPDEEIIKALKSIFLNMVAMDADDRREQIGYQLFQLCKKLTSMDILVLKACCEIYQENNSQYHKVHSHGEWVTKVSKRIGYGLPELVGVSDDKLVGFGLLSGRTSPDRSGVRKGREFRLTTLSLKLCEYITGWGVK